MFHGVKRDETSLRIFYMKKTYIIGVVVIVIIGLVFILKTNKSPQDKQLVGETLLVSSFTSGGVETGKVLLQVPFVRTLETSRQISIAVDTDQDGSYSPNEYLVTDFPVRPRENWRSGYYAASGTTIDNGMQAQVTIDGKDYKAKVQTKVVEVGALFDLASVTDPENSMKGWGVSQAKADSHVIEITQDGVPDLNQRTGECAPTSAANSLISLVNRNGGDDLVAGDPQDFIENLKRHMNWTPENGVLPDDFVAGKNRWAAAAGVPIMTTKVGDTHGLTTIDAIREALQNGDAVELRLKFANSAGTQLVGGHMVTVVGIHQSDGQTYLEINDPGTPNSGTETVEVINNQITNYGPWEGVTLLSWGFVQSWVGHPTGTLLDTMTDEEIIGIRQFAGETPMLTVIEYNGKFLPTSQLIVESEAGCDGGTAHWHAARGTVTATDGTEVADPGPQCGYGKVEDRPSQNIPAPNVND